MSKQILMIAGPNGAGKTTMTYELIQNCSILYEFINADEIARGLAPKHPESVSLAASKLMIQRLKDLINAEQSFAFETTGAGTNYIKHLKLAKAKGYTIRLTYLWLLKPEEAVKRVKQRVKQGGHHVQEEAIIRRYYAGIKNLILYYLPIADIAFILDNSAEGPARRVVASKNINNTLEIIDKEIWTKMEKIAHV